MLKPPENTRMLTLGSMPSCVAEGCGARSDKGELLKVFPRKDLKRRQIWINRVNRPGWSPTKHSALCEKHFDRDQWELPREDGKRKLKNTAVPTIFCVEHPHNDDVVSKDHAYCILGYRQIYMEKDTQDSGGSEGMMPIEHIKLEVDENLNDNFSLEHFGEKSQMEEEEMDVVQEPVEDIQCTPDIFVYPEHGEPDPIEMVDCEEDEINASMCEPSNDPLAISADDVVQAKSVVPHFGHSQKFQFITKSTKYLLSAPTDVKGEPFVKTEVPRLKVTNLQRLLNPSSSLLSSPPKPQVLAPPSSVANPSSGLRLVTTESLYPLSPPKLQTISSSNFSSQPLIKVVSQNHLGQNSSEDLSTPLVINVNPNQPRSTLVMSSGMAELDLVKPLWSSPKLVPLLNMDSSKNENTFIKLSSLKPNSKSIAKKHSMGNFRISDHFQANSNFLQTHKKESNGTKNHKVVINSMQNCAQLEGIFLEHHYTNKPLWKPITMDGIKVMSDVRSLPANKFYRLIGNNDVKMWINKKKPIKSLNKFQVTSRFKKIHKNFLGSPGKTAIPKRTVIPIESSSVVILNPFDKSQPVQLNLNQTDLLSNKKQKVHFYHCSICKYSFLTLATLKLHMTTHTEPKSNSKGINNAETEVVVDDNDGSLVDEGVKKENHTSGENAVVDNLEVKEELVEDFEVENKTSKISGRRIKTPRRFENDILCIPNLNALKNLKETNSNFPKVKLKKPTKSLKKYKKNKPTSLISQIPKVDETTKLNLTISKHSSEANNSSEKTDLELKDFGKKYSLRAKRKICKPKLMETKNYKHNIANKKPVPILDCSPIVLLSKVDYKIKKEKKTIEKTNSNDKEEGIMQGHHSPPKEVKKDLKSISHDNTTESNPASDEYNKRKCDSATVKCRTCDQIIQKSLMKSHMVLHANSEYKCSVCNKNFLKSFQLRRHVSFDHKIDKSFKCPRRDCSRTFESKRFLAKHMRTHKK